MKSLQLRTCSLSPTQCPSVSLHVLVLVWFPPPQLIGQFPQLPQVAHVPYVSVNNKKYTERIINQCDIVKAFVDGHNARSHVCRQINNTTEWTGIDMKKESGGRRGQMKKRWYIQAYKRVAHTRLTLGELGRPQGSQGK